jgi:hypothetical protein
VNGRIVRHTIKTYAMYGLRPALYIRRPDGVIHKLINGRLTGPDGPTRVWQSESPATAPDTIALSFDVALIGNPDTYEWRAIANCAGSGADVAPDAGWTEHRLRAGLARHPRANGAYRDGAFELYSRINIGIAVASDDALVVPTVFDADQKSLGAIAAESRRLAGLVRDAGSRRASFPARPSQAPTSACTA